MTDRRIVYMDLDKIEGAAVNPKGHAEEALAVSLERWGFTEAPLLDERTGRLVVGHGRLDALRARRDRGEGPPDGVRVTKAGRWQVPAQRGWASRDDQEAFAYLVAGNQLTTAGGWTPELGPALDELTATGTSLDGLGFTGDELDQLLPSRQPPPPPSVVDEIGEPPADPVTRRGDVWEIGPHRLMCGDATQADDRRLALGGLAVGEIFVWADPPYGIGYQSVRGSAPIAADQDAATARAVTIAALAPVATAQAHFVCCDWRSLGMMAKAMAEAEVVAKCCIVWDKGARVQNLDRFAKQHEMILYAGPYGGQPTLDTDVWLVPRDFSAKEHATPKPVQLAVRAMLHASAYGQAWYDPFTGSGCSLLAAAATRRVGLGVEIDPGYCDVTLARLQRHTGLVPTRGGVPHDFTPA